MTVDSDHEEDDYLEKLSIDSKEQESFNKLSMDTKLSKLNNLVQKSQIYSKIIAENLIANMNDKNKNKTTGSPKKVNTKRKRTSGGNKNIDHDKGDTGRQPKLVSGVTMRDYQLDGLDFLISLYENGLNGILADEMGLGKTLQCIAFISFLMEQGIKGPFFVVAPLSTLGNWYKEFEKFTPTIKVLKYTGPKDERLKLRTNKKFDQYNVILSSYEISMRDHSFMKTINWKYLIVDEGHRLKNNKSLLIQKLKELQVSNRLLITGTPLQNNLDELWSLLNFILPDIFHDLHLFQQWFNFDELTSMKQNSSSALETKIIELNIQKSLVENLHTILKPFILRRLKKEVVKNLPPKKEYIVYVSLSEKQRKLYEDTLSNNLFESIVRMYFSEYLQNQYEGKFSSKEVVDFLNEKFKCVSDIIGFKRRKIQYKNNLKEEESDDEFESSNQEHLVDYGDELSKANPVTKNEIKNHIYQKVTKEIRNKSLQNGIMQLRNICNSPYIFYEPFDIEDKANNDRFMKVFYENSCKMIVLKQLLEGLLPKKHKILIFSQFTKMLDLLNDWLVTQEIEVARLDGSYSQLERQDSIDKFNSEKGASIFLLSTRAGGLGINLTSADTVILFDSDWNPQMDLQAIDRAHRIGQTKPVKIYRLVVRDSIEEVLLFKSYSKKILNKVIIRMNEHKISSIESILNDDNNEQSDELMNNLKNLIDLPTKFNHKFNRKNFKINEDTNFETNILSEAEMNELLDRSTECYENDEVNFQNVSVFETINNMEQ